MNDTPNTNETITGDADTLDPHAAAALLEQATRQARRRFQASPPLLSVFRAVVVLVIFGGVWLSVRAQHPYIGPSGWVLAIAFSLVAILIRWSTSALKRAAISGPAQQKRWVGIGVMLVAWVAVYVFMGALAHAGVSPAIVYGLYPAAAPLMIVGLVGAADAAAREDWRMVGTTLPIAVVAMVAAYGGPVNVWLIMAIGLCVVFLGTAAFTVWEQRRSVIRS